MPSRTTALHHNHRRTKKRADHPVIDKLIYFAAVFSPAMTLDQVWIIWVDQNAAGISLLTWLSYTLTTCIWLAYGIAHKERVIIFSNIIWLVLNSLIVLGVILYA
jgi:MtN3 and saliva related transmembrane protein